MSKQFFKNWLLLIGVGLTTVCLVQILEFPFHKDFFRFKTLYLPLLLLSGSIYVLLGIPALTSMFVVHQSIGLKFKFFRRHSFLLTFFPFIIILYFFQYWAILNAQLAVGKVYHILFPVILLTLFILSWKQRWRKYIALVAPVVLILMAFGRVLYFSTPTWNAKLSKSPDQPNVLLLVADTLRRDHTTIYGHDRDTTPFLASIAEQGVVFDDTLAASAWTKPSMAQLLTSRYLEQDRILIGPLPVQWKGMRLPEFFHRSGYQTALLTSNPNTGSYFEATRGQKWIVQATPPRHFALQNFVFPKLLHSYLRVKDWLKYRNSKVYMDQLSAHLGFDAPKHLSKFKFGQLQSDALAESEVEDYRKLAKRSMRNFSMANIRVRKRYPAWRRKFVVPVMDRVYRGILKFCYITLEGANGKIENHWINDSELTEHFFDWYENRHDQKRPFFVHMQYMGPHTPYREQPPYFLPHFDKESGLDIENPPSQHTLPAQGVQKMAPEKHHSLLANYDNSIRITDANIKRVVDFLKEKGELENTIIAFASDHGEAFHEHQIYGHMYSLHAEVVNVPLFFYYPDKLNPGRSDLPASLVDLFPSLIDLAGLEKYRPKAGDLEGLSLFTSDATVADAGLFEDRVRYGITRTSFNPHHGKNKNGDQAGRQRQGKRRRRARQDRQQPPEEPQIKPEAIHRMVVKNSQKLVEEIDGKDRRVFMFSIDDPTEERVERNYDDSEVAALYPYFRPLPQEYLDANEPEIQHDQKGEPEPAKEPIAAPKKKTEPVALHKK